MTALVANAKSVKSIASRYFARENEFSGLTREFGDLSVESVGNSEG